MAHTSMGSGRSPFVRLCMCGGVSGIRGSIMCVAGLELEGLKTAGLLLSVLLLKLE